METSCLLLQDSVAKVYVTNIIIHVYLDGI